MRTHWYAIKSKPRKEDVLWRQLRAREIEVFYPRLRVNPVNPRAKKIKPYFPGYMFVNLNLKEIGLSALMWMPFSNGLVMYGDEPARVPENLIFDIRKRVQDIDAAGGEMLEKLKPGDKVRIQAGPFAGYEAIFNEQLPGNERVRVLLELINDRQVPLELRAGEIDKK